MSEVSVMIFVLIVIVLQPTEYTILASGLLNYNHSY